MNIVSHADLIAVINDGTPRQRKDDAVEQLDLPAVVVQQRRQAPGDPDIAAHLRIAGIGVIHVVALFSRAHFQGQFVVVPEKQAPLA